MAIVIVLVMLILHIPTCVLARSATIDIANDCASANDRVMDGGDDRDNDRASDSAIDSAGDIASAIDGASVNDSDIASASDRNIGNEITNDQSE